MIEQNMEKNEGKQGEKRIIVYFIEFFFRHNIIELIETEKEYVKDLALIVEVKFPFELIFSFHI